MIESWTSRSGSLNHAWLAQNVKRLLRHNFVKWRTQYIFIFQRLRGILSAYFCVFVYVYFIFSWLENCGLAQPEIDFDSRRKCIVVDPLWKLTREKSHTIYYYFYLVQVQSTDSYSRSRQSAVRCHVHILYMPFSISALAPQLNWSDESGWIRRLHYASGYKRCATHFAWLH